MLVTDTSGSMEATDVEPTRLAAARTPPARFLDRVPDELRVGLVAYSSAPHTVLRPTERAPTRARRRSTGSPPTAARRRATRWTARCARSARATDDAPPAAIVLLSDGATQEGRDPVEVADEAAAAGVPVYTVALGTADGMVESGGRVLRVPARSGGTAPRWPTLSGGATFAAEDADALDEVYERLGSQIGTREEKREISAGFAAAGLLLLGGSLLTSLRWRGRLP